MNKKTIIKALLLIAMVIIVSFDCSFAADAAATSAQQDMGTLALRLTFLVNISSRIRVLLANLAGGMLTNARVYAPKL